MAIDPSQATGAAPDGASSADGAAIEQGTYEIIRDRLLVHGRNLAGKAGTLNDQRIELFGGQKTVVVGNERVRTENNCVPRDVLALGDRLLFGYNVFIGLKTETQVGDVFALQWFRKNGDGKFEFTAVGEDDPGNFLADPRFVSDFKELYRYYKNARLQVLRIVASKLLAVFQVGDTLTDVKVLRWALGVDGSITYIDSRGEKDNTYPPSHDFEWTPCTRDDHIPGVHPHISILDKVFVETVGGDLTIKVEDNTESGEGIYAEPVDDADQALDDAQVLYAALGSLILIRILPYREETWRYLVFNTLTRRVARVDNVGTACLQLPEDHGVIFPGGYYLQRGETKTFGGDIGGMLFDRVVHSPNGEDVLYIFQRHKDGVYQLLPYNMIRKEVENPIHCHGYCLFADGRMIVFRQATEDPTRVHTMQVWQTPYVSDEFAASRPTGGSFLENVGNADLVRGISDCLSIRRMIEEQSPTLAMYEELIAATVRTMDAYYWLAESAVGDLYSVLGEVRQTSELIIDEFEKVQALRKQARDALAAVDKDLTELFRGLRPDYWELVSDFVDALSELRKGRGRLISMRDLRYVDLARIDELEQTVIDRFDEVSKKSVHFLLDAQALAPYHDRIADLEGRIEAVEKVTATVPLFEDLDAISNGLDLLTEVVGGLEIDDATVRTQILEGISEVMSALNRVRALLQARRKELLSREGIAEFGAQFNLFSQSVSSALSLADSPEKCEGGLSRLMLQLEELEARFSEFDQFLEQLATKREEVYEAFESKKQMLLDQLQRRAQNMMRAAERILGGIGRRAKTFQQVDDLNAYFASDSMVMKLRDLSAKLRELGDSVKSDEVDSRLKTAREDAVRGLRDRQDIFEDGGAAIKLGKHRFSVNTQALDLTMVPREGGMALHLTGTGYYEVLRDEAFDATRGFWDQDLVSETRETYRGEYLAYCVLTSAEEHAGKLTVGALHEAALTEGGLLAVVREYASDRYDEGYERGVHDADAALILERVLQMYQTAGLLRYAPGPRAAACLFWTFWRDAAERPLLERRAESLARLRAAFARSTTIEAFQVELAERLAAFCKAEGLELVPSQARIAGRYLFDELARAVVAGDGLSLARFTTTGAAEKLVKAFSNHLDRSATRQAFEGDLSTLGDAGALKERYQLAEAWLRAFLEGREDSEAGEHVLPEAVAIVLCGAELPRAVSSATAISEVLGLLGQHGRIEGRKMTVRLDGFLARLAAYHEERVPGYRAYQKIRHGVLEREREALRLSEYMAKVMSAFVRNKLINDVYLPLIGDNLAKQLGALGAGKRTDLMGMLLLISPPGYGKTTLMEYIANRLGLVFMKINGPALGHSVHSLDPSEAPNATARQEVMKLNLALEMGNNVLLYVDDIQHTHPEFLQKFISLCDAQRKIEGVWRGRTKTYDMRGKKFVVCMAGNPYTEAGEKFQIPDMLANRADVYNLGDILGGKDDTFALSYIENALTSNTVLAQITTHDHADIYKLVRMARGEEIPVTELSYGYSQVELGEILVVLKKLMRCQEVLLAVNQEYIRSASMDDSFRTEPRFQLQGSYRNMNKLAEKLVAVMNDAELEQLIDDHYLGEAQTLTTGAEWNLLKLREMRGVLTPEETERAAAIRDVFRRQMMMGGKDEDPTTRAVAQLVNLSDRLDAIGASIQQAATTASSTSTRLAERGASASAQAADAVAKGVRAMAEGLRTTSEAQARAQAQSGAALGEHLGAQLGPYLQRIDAALQGISEARVDIEVVNPAPMAAHALVEKQIQLIEATLVPLVRSMGHAMRSDNALWDRMGEILSAIRTLDEEESAKPAKVKKSVRPFKPQGDKEPG